MCRTYDSSTQTEGQGHRSRSFDLPFNLCLLQFISSTICYIFIRHHSNVSLRELLCRTHDSATHTQDHSSRSWVLPLNLVSALYLLNPLNINLMRETMSRTYADSRSQFKVKGFTLEFRVAAPYLLNPLNDFH